MERPRSTDPTEEVEGREETAAEYWAGVEYRRKNDMMDWLEEYNAERE